jgi:hypothetical protein
MTVGNDERICAVRWLGSSIIDLHVVTYACSMVSSASEAKEWGEEKGALYSCSFVQCSYIMNRSGTLPMLVLV